MSLYSPDVEFRVRLHGIDIGTISCYSSKSSFRFSDEYYWFLASGSRMGCAVRRG